MSRKKPNIAYIKPEEPKFLRELKAQAGYKEGPTVDTKREELSEGDDEDFEDHLEEKPVVVVLNEGDLTAEEVEDFQNKKEEEEANAPADLSKRIIFKSKSKSSNPSESDSKDEPAKKKNKKSNETKIKSVLSFNDDEDE